MEVKTQTLLNFKGVDFVHVNVISENQFPKGDNQPPIHLNTSPKVFFPEDKPTEFTIIIDAKVFSKGFFHISIIGLGYFEITSLQGNIRDQKHFIGINAPAIMFPYIRSFITTLTANLGSSFVPLNIPPQFFQGEIEEIKRPNEQIPTVESIQKEKQNS